MNAALIQRPDNRFQPALMRAGFGLSSRLWGERSGVHRSCSCVHGSGASDHVPWAFLTARPPVLCHSGGRRGACCCGSTDHPCSYKRTGSGMSAGSHAADVARELSPRRSARELPDKRETTSKPHGRRTEHPRHLNRPKAPPSKRFRDEDSPQDFRGARCFVPAFESPRLGPHEPVVRDLVWNGNELVEIRSAFRDDDERRQIENDPWTVRGLCVRPAGISGPVPFVLLMHQAGGGYHRYRGYRALQEMLASHGIASVCSSDNSKDDERFKHPGLEFSDEARRAALCLHLAERFAAANGLSFGSRVGLFGHSRGGWAAQNLATLINRGTANLFGLAVNPAAFTNVRIEGLCLVGASSHHAADPTCPILLIQGSRDEDLVLDPSWWLAGRAPSGFISVAYVRGANHNWFNSTNADDQWIRGRRGPNSLPFITGNEHVRVLAGLAVSLFRQTLLGHQTALLNGTSVLPHGAAGSAYRIAFRASDCVALLRDFGPSSVNGGRRLTMASLVQRGTHTPDVEVQAAVFNGLPADSGQWPGNVSVYVPPGEIRAAMACCGHGLILRRSSAEGVSPPRGAVGLRLPLPTSFELADWMIAITAAALDPNPTFAADAAGVRASFVGGAFYLGVEAPLTSAGPGDVIWSHPREIWPNDDLQFESAGASPYEAPGLGVQERFCEPTWRRLGHIPYFCAPNEPPPRNNGTTAYATTYWFSADCFATPKGSPSLRAAALWVYPSADASIAVQRVDLIRRARIARV